MHELVARAMRGKCVRHGKIIKVGGIAALRGFSHTTRANISHEEAEQIRARIACTPAYIGLAGVALASALTGWSTYFLLCLLAILWVFACRGRRYPVSATPTHMLRICVNSHDDPLFSRGEHCSPAKKHEETFLLLALFTDEKRGKSHLRGLFPLSRRRQPTHCVHWFIPPLLKNSLRVHELVARAMRGECVRHRVKQKSAVLPLPVASAIPRVRTYHTKKPSRFVHALPARPLKVRELTDLRSKRGRRRRDRVSGRGWSPCADGIEYMFFLLSVGYTLGFCL